jgi:integrase
MAHVRLRGSTWYVRWRDAGGKWQERRTTAKSKTEARRLAGELERKVERQELGLDPLPIQSSATFWELCSWWVESRCKPRSRDDERYRLGKHVKATALGDLPLAKVTRSAIADRLREIEAAGGAPALVNKVRSILLTVIERAKDEEPPLWVGENPVERVERRKVGRKVYHTLSAGEIDRVLSHAAKDWRGEIAAGVYMALRKGEVFGLRPWDVDLTRRVMHVRRSFDQETTKTDEETTIPIPPPLVPYLEAALARGGSLVFPGRGGKMRTKEADPQKALRTALGRAGLVLGYEHVCRRCKGAGRAPASWEHPDAAERRCPTCSMRLWPKAVPRPMRFHDLRHSTATILLELGVPMQHVQKILRHANIRTTVDLYGHMVAEDARAAVDAAWRRAGGGQTPGGGPAAPVEQGAGNEKAPVVTGASGSSEEWALQVSNLRPQPCENGGGGSRRSLRIAKGA